MTEQEKSLILENGRKTYSFVPEMVDDFIRTHLYRNPSERGIEFFCSFEYVKEERTVTHSTRNGVWEKTYFPGDAIPRIVSSPYGENIVKKIENARLDPEKSYYVTPNFYLNSKRRVGSNLRSVRNIVLDIDCHDDKYNTESGEELVLLCDKLIAFLKEFFAEFPFAGPNTYVRTGRGIQMWFAIEPIIVANRSKKRNTLLNLYISYIEAVTGVLGHILNNSELSMFSMDSGASKNIAGLMRAPGSINPKVNCPTLVTCEVVHHKVYKLFDLITPEVCKVSKTFGFTVKTLNQVMAEIEKEKEKEKSASTTTNTDTSTNSDGSVKANVNTNASASVAPKRKKYLYGEEQHEITTQELFEYAQTTLFSTLGNINEIQIDLPGIEKNVTDSIQGIVEKEKKASKKKASKPRAKKQPSKYDIHTNFEKVSEEKLLESFKNAPTQQRAKAILGLRKLRKVDVGHRNQFNLVFYSVAQWETYWNYSDDEISKMSCKQQLALDEAALVKLFQFNAGFKTPMEEKELRAFMSSATAKRYKRTNENIISALDITEKEQEELGLTSEDGTVSFGPAHKFSKREIYLHTKHVREANKQNKKERIAECVAMRLCGKTNQEISDLTGVKSRTTIKSYLDKYNSGKLSSDIAEMIAQYVFEKTGKVLPTYEFVTVSSVDVTSESLSAAGISAIEPENSVTAVEDEVIEAEDNEKVIDISKYRRNDKESIKSYTAATIFLLLAGLGYASESEQGVVATYFHYGGVTCRGSPSASYRGPPFSAEYKQCGNIW